MKGIKKKVGIYLITYLILWLVKHITEITYSIPLITKYEIGLSPFSSYLILYPNNLIWPKMIILGRKKKLFYFEWDEK